MRRSELGLASNSGRVPDAFVAVLGHGTLAKDRTRRIRVTKDRKTGKPDVRLLYSVKEIPANGGGTIRQITIDRKDAKSICTILCRERKRAGLEPLSEPQLQLAIQEILSQNANTIDCPEVLYEFSIDFAAPRKGLVKIAYELAVLWLGDKYLSDPLAASLRDFILGKSDEATPDIRAHFAAPHEIDKFGLWSEPKNCHVAFSVGTHNSIAIGLKIFDIVGAVTEVSGLSERYLRGPFDPDGSRFLCIDPVAKTKRESSLIDEIRRIVVSMQPRAPTP